MTVFTIIQDYWPAILNGLGVTLSISAQVWLIGLALGMLIGAMAYRLNAVAYVLHAIAFVALSIPFLVWLYWFHYPVQEYFGVVIEPEATTVYLLTFLNTVAVAEIWCAALKNTDYEGYVVARMYGLKPWRAVWHIQVPIATRQALPMLLAFQVAVLQLTLFSSLISTNEIFRVVQRINSSVHKTIEIYTALALFFLLICGPLYLMAFLLQRRFRRQLGETG